MRASEREGKAVECLPQQDDSSKRQWSTVSKQDTYHRFHEIESVSDCVGFSVCLPPCPLLCAQEAEPCGLYHLGSLAL